MYWDDLAYFVSLVEHQTLTACAEEMGVQHSTVARRIERLEQTLAVPLFDRIGKRYVLTQEGALLYHQAVAIKDEVAMFERMAIDQNAMQGRVVVSAPPVWANEILLPKLAHFKQQFPDILLALYGEVGLSDLHQREADIAVRAHRPTQEDLIIRRIGSVTYGFFAHCDYLKHTIPECWQLIEFGGSARVLAWSQALMMQHSYTVAFSTNDLYIAYHAASQKLGVALLPQFLANKHPELVAVNPIQRTALYQQAPKTVAQTWAQTHSSDAAIKIKGLRIDTTTALTQNYPLYLVMHPDVRRSARVRVVADWLIATTVQLS